MLLTDRPPWPIVASTAADWPASSSEAWAGLPSEPVIAAPAGTSGEVVVDFGLVLV